MAFSKGKGLIALGAALVLLDQVTKVLVKTNMTIGEAIPVIGDFLRICFVENEGMAFGMSWGGAVGKVLLSVFRIALFGFLWWWISSLIKKGYVPQQKASGKAGGGVAPESAASAAKVLPVPTGVLVGLTLIAAGALGNIIDCWFYGLVFGASDVFTVASFGDSYAPFMMGKVVDMISFSIFPPVFNVADSCVTVGAAYLILFQWRFFSGYGSLPKESQPTDSGKAPAKNSGR